MFFCWDNDPCNCAIFIFYMNLKFEFDLLMFQNYFFTWSPANLFFFVSSTKLYPIQNVQTFEEKSFLKWFFFNFCHFSSILTNNLFYDFWITDMILFTRLWEIFCRYLFGFLKEKTLLYILSGFIFGLWFTLQILFFLWDNFWFFLICLVFV